MLTVILAGGQSRRMGSDKAMLRGGESTILQMLIDRYSALGDVAVSVDKPGRFAFRGAMELCDEFPGDGPLNGICSAFAHTEADRIFLTATDIPNGSPELARLLFDRLGSAGACVIDRGEGSYEPVFAAYSRACLDAARNCLASGQRSFYKLYGKIKITPVPIDSLSDWDISQILLNMNTPEDYEKWTRAGK